MKRKLKKIFKRILVIAAFLTLLYFFPFVTSAFILCGVWDVSRNRGLDASVFKQYFLKNGIGTWLASPLNILLDILALPYRNKGVYELKDLPTAYQAEIGGLLKKADDAGLVDLLESKTRGLPRAMYFFKWYGRNQETSIEIPAFHDKYKFIRTIGVSAFRERESTSRHFGPFRASLRVLYSLNPITDENVYIKVGPVENRWKDKRLFIFDDTFLHQSFNEADDPRYVLFVDIIRPSYLPFVFDFAVSLIRIFFKGINGVFYKNWKLLNN